LFVMRNQRPIDAAKLALLFLAPVLLMVIPTSTIESGPTLCLFKLIFGVRCPGCGMTRAVSAMMHGDVTAAFAYNRLIVIAFPILCWIYGKALVSTVCGLLQNKVTIKAPERETV